MFDVERWTFALVTKLRFVTHPARSSASEDRAGPAKQSFARGAFPSRAWERGKFPRMKTTTNKGPHSWSLPIRGERRPWSAQATLARRAAAPRGRVSDLGHT